MCILALAGLQFVIAYQHIDVSSMIFRMFAIALLEAGLAVVFFMHLGSENRIFVTWVLLVTLFVFAALQYSWTDSYRMERDAPKSFTTDLRNETHSRNFSAASPLPAGRDRSAAAVRRALAVRPKLRSLLHPGCCIDRPLYSGPA